MVNKKLMMLAIFLVGLLAVSAVSAADNDTIDIASADDVTIDETLTASNNRIDIYFDASARVDGNGSITNPYKFVDGNRIESNSNMYFKNGQYTLNSWYLYSNISFYGENPEETIIDFENSLIQIEDSLLINNITFKRYSSYVFDEMTASNSTFDGGCFYNDYSVVTACGNSNMIFDNCIFINNYNENGIINLAFDSDVVINNCKFLNNLAGECGAIYSINSRLNITGTTFKNNRGNNSASVILNSGELFISNCDFINNSAYSGGSIYLDKASLVVIENSRFNNNRAFAGGSIFDIESENVYLNKCDFTNSSSVYGGALALLGTNSNINDCTFNNNQAVEGGAIYHVCGDSRLTKSEFTNNIAENGGGIIVIGMDNVAINENDFTSNSVNAIVSDNENLSYQNNSFLNNDVFLNYIPNLFIGSGNYTLLRANDTIITVIPERYDPRDTGMITPARDQGDMDYCWVFGTIATLESCILKTTGLKFDFSELNVANIISKYSYGFRYGSEGWHSTAAVAYLLNWFGPINETEDTYDSNKPVSSVLNSLFHIQNVKYFQMNDSTDLNTIKEAILRYGAVGTDMCFSNDYLNGTAYYDPNYDEIDHTTAIVGWDDNFSKDKFKITPPGNGAWIIKNSWGEADGYGCYYVSYYDTTLGAFDNSMFTFIFNDTIKFDKNYQYDFGDTYRYEFSENTIWYKNVFNSTENEYLGAVSTYFHRDYDWEMYVYVNGEFVHNQTGRSGYGFYTINLDNIIALNKGDTFEIIFKLSSLDNNTVFFPLMSYKYNDFEGKTFISADNNSWMAPYDVDEKPLVACIKAFTFLNEITTHIDLNIDNTADNIANITAFITDEYGNRVIRGNVTFDLAGVKYTVGTSNGAANILYQFTKPTNLVSATFNGVGYETSSANQTITLQINSVVTADDVSVVYGDANGKLVAKLTDFEGTPISANIVIKLNGVTYSIKTNSKGQASVSTAKLTPGTYTATISYAGNETYNPSNATAQVIVNKAGTVISAPNVSVAYKDPNGKLVATITNAYGRALAVNVNVNFNGESYTVRADSQGQITIPTSTLSPGTYTATVSYAGNVNYNASSTTAIITVNKADTVITASNVSVVYKDPNGKLVAILTNTYGKPLAVNVNVNFNGESYTVRADSQGQITIPTSTLSPGTYTATVSYAGNVNYNASSTTAIITVNKADTVITAPNVSVNYTNPDGKLVATLTNVYGKALAVYVNVTLNGETYALKANSKGQVIIPTADLTPKKYTVTISYKGNVNYNPSSATARITVTKADTVMAASDVSVNFSNPDGKFVATLTNAYGKALSVYVNVTFNGETYAVRANSKGEVIIPTADLTPKKYTVTIAYKGNGNYNPSSVTSKITVTKADTVMAAPNVSVNYTNPDGKFVATLTNAYGKALSVYVNVTFNGETYAVRANSKGEVIIPTADLTPKKYTVTIAYKGNGNYNPSSVTSKITVTKADTVMTAPDVSVAYKDTANTTIATLTNAYGKALAVYVNVTVNGEKFAVRANNKGQVSISTANLAPGTYAATISYKGNGNYNPSSATAQITVNKADTTIIAQNVSVAYKDTNGKLVATITNAYGKPLSVYVNVNLNGVDYTVRADSKGQIILSTADLAPGTYTATITYKGNGNYNPSNTTAQITVNRADTIITARDVTVSCGDPNGKLVATLTNVYGKALSVYVNVNLNGQTYALRANSQGKINIPTKDLASGTYTATITYNGNGNYNPTNTTAHISVI